MEHVRNRQAEKRRDLARSTCSPLGSVAREARKAKRNANRRERRAQKASLIAVRKAPCLCDEDPNHYPRCDHEMSHFDVKTSRPKTWPWFHLSHCYEYRWQWDKFSQIYRWVESREAELSRTELLQEIHSLGRRPAHAHAIFHLLMHYSPSQTGKAAPPKMTVAALTSALRERGVEYCEHPEQLLATIAERICTHGKFAAANQWSFELCYGIYVDADGVRIDGAQRPVIYPGGHWFPDGDRWAGQRRRAGLAGLGRAAGQLGQRRRRPCDAGLFARRFL